MEKIIDFLVQLLMILIVPLCILITPIILMYLFYFYYELIRYFF